MSITPDRLERFVQAQKRDYEHALAELKAGRKRSHWIWYVLPQLRELGYSELAREYGIDGRSEAQAYLCHPILGPRLIDCVNAILRHTDKYPEDIIGEVDAKKFRSCLTLFAEVAPDEPVFTKALRVFYAGESDEATLRLLRRTHGGD